MAHMSAFVAALPMYDWPECRDEVNAQWARLHREFSAIGIDAPEHLARCNADLPPVPGGIRDAGGRALAPDPATIDPDELDLRALWHHPKLLFAQTCWGPMELGLRNHVRVAGQPDYGAFEGGNGAEYSSAIIMRGPAPHVAPPTRGLARLPLDLLRGKRLAFNSHDSMSGLISITRDLAALGEGADFWSETIRTDGHRASIATVAQGRADVCAVDCRTWSLAQRFEPHAGAVAVVGWTARRPGLPYIAGLDVPRYRVAADADCPLGRVVGLAE